MKKDVESTIKRAQRFQTILIAEGILVGAAAGIVVLLYRTALGYADIWLRYILEFAETSAALTAGWFAVLAAIAFVTARLVDWEPMISGSGIPQLEGEIGGKLDPVWWKVVIAKFTGGFFCMLGGLALGREGPSIQLGAMTGKGISRKLDRGKTEEKFLLTCGASAGLAAAFHAPLAGVMFSLEEIHKNFSVSVLLSVTTASITADFLCSLILGTDSVFRFDIIYPLPTAYYWMIVILGLILGLAGAFYNWFTLKVQALYKKVKLPGTFSRILVPFMISGALGFTCPQLLGSGERLIEELTGPGMTLGIILLILAGRFVFSAVCFGSGAPGVIFFPLLVLGGFIGGAFAMTGVQYFGLDSMYVNNFVLLAMAGYFAAIVRAPITGIVLIFEMTGSLSQMLSLSIVSVTAYTVASLLGSKPIYESLLERLLRNGEKDHGEDEASDGQKVLTRYVIQHGSEPAGKQIKDVKWPDHCLLVAVERGSDELIPKGRTRLEAGDVIITMADERDSAAVHEAMIKICSGTVR